jgi:hypothetical protein
MNKKKNIEARRCIICSKIECNDSKCIEKAKKIRGVK